MPPHVPGHGRLTHRDPQLPKLPMDPGAPHSGFAVDSSRISARTSAATPGRPLRCRLFQVQNKRKPRRRHARTVSGLTMRTPERQSRHDRDSHAHSTRSTVVKQTRRRRDRFTTASWCRSAMISRCSALVTGTRTEASGAARRRRTPRPEASRERPQPQSIQGVPCLR